jgi:hypothetical protein
MMKERQARWKDGQEMICKGHATFFSSSFRFLLFGICQVEASDARVQQAAAFGVQSMGSDGEPMMLPR